MNIKRLKEIEQLATTLLPNPFMPGNRKVRLAILDLLDYVKSMNQELEEIINSQKKKKK